MPETEAGKAQQRRLPTFGITFLVGTRFPQPMSFSCYDIAHNTDSTTFWLRYRSEWQRVCMLER